MLRARVARERSSNVTLILSEPADPKLPRGAIDMALMVDVYHELGDPQTVLGHIRKALKPNGRLVLVEYKGEDPSIPILPSHKMTVAQAKLEVENEGFVLTTGRLEPAASARVDLYQAVRPSQSAATRARAQHAGTSERSHEGTKDTSHYVVSWVS